MERTEEGRDLIETLWNVKYARLKKGYLEFGDLIETLWNVKQVDGATLAPHNCRFNRDIVECKVFYHCPVDFNVFEI